MTGREIWRKERVLEQWNKGEADGWKWRSNWIGRFVKMWWHKQSVHCYCTLLEVEGNILKLQEKKKGKNGKESRELPALCQEWSPQVFSLCSLADSLSSILWLVCTCSIPPIRYEEKNVNWDLFNISIVSLNQWFSTDGSQVFWGTAANSKCKNWNNAKCKKN